MDKCMERIDIIQIDYRYHISDTWIEYINSNGLERKEKAWHGMTWNGETKK